MRHERAWHIEPPGGRVWALVFRPYTSSYVDAQWEPRLQRWSFYTAYGLETVRPETEDVYWYPLPEPPAPYSVHEKTHALEER